MDFNFPGSDIAHISPPDVERRSLAGEEPLAEMLVNFLGLAGAHGPLPAVYTEGLLDKPSVTTRISAEDWGGSQKKRARNSALRDFLDIFNHRLVLLLYRVHAMHHPELTDGSPDEGLAANHLYAFFGLGREPESAARSTLGVSDRAFPRALLHYSGLLAHRPHSANGLQRLLSDYLQVPVAIEEFVGAWLSLSEDQWTRIGTRQGGNQRLGDGAILGKRIWDQHARINVRLGPLDLSTFERFLPGRVAYKPLQKLTRFYLGDEVDFSFKLVLRAREVPEGARIDDLLQQTFPIDISGSRLQVREVELGRLSWLKSDKRARDNDNREASSPDPVVVIRGEL